MGLNSIHNKDIIIDISYLMYDSMDSYILCMKLHNNVTIIDMLEVCDGDRKIDLLITSTDKDLRCKRKTET